MKFFVVFLFIASVTAPPPEHNKDTSKDVPITRDSQASSEEGSMFCLNDFNAKVTKDECVIFIQEVKKLKVLVGNHICTIMNLIYGCHAKVKVLSKDNGNVVTDGDYLKQYTVQFLVDDQTQAATPISIKATRAVLVDVEKKLNEKTRDSIEQDLLTYVDKTDNVGALTEMKMQLS